MNQPIIRLGHVLYDDTFTLCVVWGWVIKSSRPRHTGTIQERGRGKTPRHVIRIATGGPTHANGVPIGLLVRLLEALQLPPVTSSTQQLYWIKFFRGAKDGMVYFHANVK